MRLYRVTGPLAGVDTDRFVGTQEEAAARRKALVEAGARRAELTTEEVEVPTDKKGLIEFLNSLA